jgi:hypothetical protein
MRIELSKLYFIGDGLDHDYVDLHTGSISFGVAMKFSANLRLEKEPIQISKAGRLEALHPTTLDGGNRVAGVGEYQ